MNTKQKNMWSMIGTVCFTILSALWMYPIIMVVMNSLKVERAITTEAAFTPPSGETFAGIVEKISQGNLWGNHSWGINRYGEHLSDGSGIWADP